MAKRDLTKEPWHFWKNVPVGGAGCWEWTGTRAVWGGYGVIQHCGKQWKAHRVAYLLTHGAIDEAKIVCHRCDNPSCVRPDHLYQGTFTDNNRDTVKRGRRAAPKTHCKNGHPFTPENTWVAYKSAGVATGRRCAICTNELNKASYHRNKTRWKPWRERHGTT
jgi:hypothetical protein